MSHIFDDKKFKKLESPERFKILPPALILSHLKINTGDIIADVGCGIGFFSFPFADATGEKGLVKATDISDTMIYELNKRIQERNYTNIETIKSSKTSLGVETNSVDLFFTSTLVHELDDLDTFTTHAISTLKAKGQIAYLDFEKKDTGFGPPVEKRIASDQVMRLFKASGLNDILKYDINDAFYLVIGKK